MAMGSLETVSQVDARSLLHPGMVSELTSAQHRRSARPWRVLPAWVRSVAHREPRALPTAGRGQAIDSHPAPEKETPCPSRSRSARSRCTADATYDTTTPIGSFLLGDTFYTNDFGFTSAACAIVAGVCARILAADPSLTWREVREVIARSCRKIDEAGGSYDERGHSPYYGFGRLDLSAVNLPNQKNAATSV